MNASPLTFVPTLLSRLVLVSFGALVLSSCASGEVSSAPAPAANNAAVSPEPLAASPGAVAPDVVAQAGGANGVVEAGTVAPPIPRMPAPAAPAPISVAGAPSGSLANAASNLPDIAPDLEIGLNYLDARARLIQQGWVPTVAPEPGLYGVERQLYDQGITEVWGCSGTGVGACRFEFSHPERASSGQSSALSVITYGGSRTEVADWELQAAAVPSAVEPVAARPAEVPAQFQGLWNASQEQCSNPSSDGRLLIEPNFIRFYESSGPIVEIKTRGANEVALTMELSGEGSTWTKTDYYQLSADGLSILRNDDPLTVRYRCS